MPDHRIEDIRNIALAGHSQGGKTTLTEALLAAAGAINQPGSVSRGTTVSDHLPLEKKAGHSLAPALCHLRHRGAHVNLLDTPGYNDFLGRSLAVLPAVETVAVVIHPRIGIDATTQRLMSWSAERRLDRLLIINHIDEYPDKLADLLAQLREQFGRECLPLNLPAERGSRVQDCFFHLQGGATDLSSIEQAHTEIIDQVVEVDEALMELYLEQGQSLQPEQLHEPFEKALRDGHLIPVCFTSAETGAGIPQLLDIIARLMPHPGEGNPPDFLRGEGSQAELLHFSPDADAHALAHVFQVQIDPFAGKLALLRIHQGRIDNNSQLYIGDGRKPLRLNHLLRLQGKRREEIHDAVAGDICALAKIEEIRYDTVLHDSHEEDHIHLRPLALPQPMYGLAIEARSRGDEQKLSDALHKLAIEDPSLRVEHNANLNETVLRGQGDLHLRLLLEDMRQRFGISVDTRPPSIAYRETITRPAEAKYRHKKQTGGAGQFGEVHLRIEPLPRGAGVEFVDEVVGGAIPKQFLPAVEKGINQAIAEGVIAGYPVQDVRVTVFDGKHHPVDSKEVAFVTAARKAFLEAAGEAAPRVLEPVVHITVTTPASHTGDITADLSSRHGQINGTDVGDDHNTVIRGSVPLSALEDYHSRLKSLTGGEGEFTLSLSHYDYVPAAVQRELASRFQGHRQEG